MHLTQYEVLKGDGGIVEQGWFTLGTRIAWKYYKNLTILFTSIFQNKVNQDSYCKCNVAILISIHGELSILQNDPIHWNKITTYMPVVQEDDNDKKKYMISNTKSSLQQYLRVASLRDVHICMTPKLLPRILEYLQV